MRIISKSKKVFVKIYKYLGKTTKKNGKAQKWEHQQQYHSEPETMPATSPYNFASRKTDIIQLLNGIENDLEQRRSNNGLDISMKRTQDINSPFSNAYIDNKVLKQPNNIVNIEQKQWYFRLNRRLNEIDRKITKISTTITEFSGKKQPVEDEGFIQGQIDGLVLSDVLNLLSSNNKTGVLTIFSNEKKLDIFLSKGEILDARCNDINGMDAFQLMFEINTGFYFFKERNYVDCPRVFNANVDHLTMEALRLTDEKKSRGTLDPAASNSDKEYLI